MARALTNIFNSNKLRFSSVFSKDSVRKREKTKQNSHVRCSQLMSSLGNVSAKPDGVRGSQCSLRLKVEHFAF